MPINYYEILNCHPSDTIEEIKKSYQALVLKHHPDKQNTTGDRNVLQLFYQIDEAWKMLRDPEQRKKYDAEMQQHRFNDEPIVYAKIYRKDFEFDADSQSNLYPCRCGGYFVLPDDCIESSDCDNGVADSSIDENCGENDEVYIECDECSFVVQLLRNQNTNR
ncbi:dnaJ homolog subfamily C member 24-like [Sitodiplosis mosellana]|uniref:dnaJ homolog subfamily C member 24-like n=1 Tax=Sitodiplosis mosellana TaxID=263140 RepID=UPI002444D388|nr:dnaJ homolog subfamily C member 24-like [Sitodiplosis mosellana]